MSKWPFKVVPQYELPEPAKLLHLHTANGTVNYYTADQLRQEIAKAEQRGRESMRCAHMACMTATPEREAVASLEFIKQLTVIDGSAVIGS